MGFVKEGRIYGDKKTKALLKTKDFYSPFLLISPFLNSLFFFFPN